MNKNLTLTGMMGVGKSTIGKNLAKKLNYNFVDIDKLIEIKEGASINLIFKNKSEKYFRKIEHEITLKELEKDKSVISLGGGAFMNKELRKIIKQKSKSFWLHWSSETLIKRIKNNDKRPVIKDMSSLEIKKLISERNKIYYFSDFKIICESLKKHEIVNKILQKCKKNEIIC